MKPYLLLTPGPLTTSETVKEAMMTDWCTWDADYNVHIVEEIRKSLVALATTATDEYTSVLLQGSGTYCVEAVIGSVITPKHKLLILSNGAYGDRMGHIAEYHGINYDMLAFEETEQVSVDYVDDYLSNNSDITHVAVVHCETTTGILNPLKEIAHIVKLHNKKLLLLSYSYLFLYLFVLFQLIDQFYHLKIYLIFLLFLLNGLHVFLLLLLDLRFLHHRLMVDVLIFLH